MYGDGAPSTAINFDVLSGTNGWFGGAHEHTSTGQTWYVNVQLICGNVN